MNENIFKVKLLERRKSVKDIANLLGIKRESMYYKIKKGTFTTKEATKICNFLNLSIKERCDIFLPFN